MKTGTKLLVSALLTTLIFSLIYAIFDPRFAIFAAIVVAGHVLLLGIPAFMLLHRLRCLSGLTLAMAGFIEGSVPSGIFRFTYHTSGQDLHVLAAFVGLVIFGMFGLVSALGFGVAWNLLSAKGDRFRWNRQTHAAT